MRTVADQFADTLGYTLDPVEVILNGRVDEVIDLARANSWR